ncbi:hypothetical protein E4P40_10175 [Blastococcus sp. CT_GayMR20]|uniref:hypothetical protein n=1 Tax=Blastococcus sp. CT_GayMR20 TaxID=2559609 RepID=UPI0010746E44|nr:hypothetical protein [Blastococcus sp. CT_GayMR20]TFV88180.1 hypothetical protein E4P40_10175 [Blastococcus sp. CT_GayMR20]
MVPVETETRPTQDGVLTGTRWLLVAFAALTALAVFQLLVLADVADRYWAWSIRTELTAAFLGAAYGAGFVLAVASLRQPDWSRIRVPVLTVTVFTVLTAVATGIHLHRLHLVDGGPFARVAAWVWLGVYLVVPLACLLVVIREERRRMRPAPVRRPMPDWLTVVLTLEGAVMFTAGVVLFGGGMTVHHQREPEPAANFWPWELTPLSAQIVGSWLIALGVAAALVIRQGDLGRLFVSGVTYTAFGVFQFVAVAWYWPQISRHDARLWIYFLFLVAIVLTGAYGWWAARRGAPRGDDAERLPVPVRSTP